MRLLKHVPWLTVLLIVANIAIFKLQPGLNPAAGTPEDQFLRVIWPEPLDILNRALSGEILSTLLVIPGLVLPVFMHANFEHLFGNMMALALFGWILERQVGWKRMLAIYAVAGLAGQGLMVLMNIRSLGASGAICGVMGACVGLLIWPPSIWRALRKGQIVRVLLRIWIGVSSYHMVQALWLQVLSGKSSGEMNVDGQVFGVGDFAHLFGLMIGLAMIGVYLLFNEIRRQKELAARKAEQELFVRQLSAVLPPDVAVFVIDEPKS